jgi:hypothetical protein
MALKQAMFYADHVGAYLGRGSPGEAVGHGGVLALEAVLVHDPAGLAAPGGPPRVEDERFLHADERPSPQDLPVLARRLPVPRFRRPVSPRPRRVLAVLHHEEVPLLLPHRCPSCINITSQARLTI